MYRLSKLEQTVRRPKRLPLHPAKSAQKNCRHLCPHGDRSPLKVTTDNCLEIDSRVHIHIYPGPLLDSCALSTYLCEAVGNGINIYWFSPSMVHVLIRSWYFPHLAQIMKNCYPKLAVSFQWEENQVLPLHVSFFSATLPRLWRFHHPLQARLNSNFLHIAQKLIKHFHFSSFSLSSNFWSLEARKWLMRPNTLFRNPAVRNINLTPVNTHKNITRVMFPQEITSTFLPPITDIT